MPAVPAQLSADSAAQEWNIAPVKIQSTVARTARLATGKFVALAAGALACGLMSLACVLRAERGRLFRPQHAGAAGSYIKAV
ncbi:MAG: hypothetical protein ACHQIL_08620 [Steroidobacterales bacterium]